MKKIISMIICVCMFASMFTLVGSAAGVSISIVRISMTEPKAGGQKPMDAKVPETASSVVTNVTWEGNFDANGCFVGGNEYTVFVEVGVKDSRSEFKEKLSTLTLNEKNAKLYSVGSDRKSIVVCYTFSIPASASAPAPALSTSTGFADVADDAYYAAAVKWAVEKGITSGTSATTFSPDDTCTKAQILTFLWRAMGSPKMKGSNPFKDVKSSDYFYDAALWARSKGMVEGNIFAGNTPCTRSATVTYLWINANAPKATYTGSFADVSKNASYASAVAWAVEKGITSGTSKATFSPDATCTRAQIVTFLQRAL